MSIIQKFSENVTKTPNKTALIAGNTVLTYRQLACQVSSISHNLLAKGVKKGDHVAVLLPNSIEFVIVMLVAANIGIVLVPHNMTLGSNALSRALQAADIKHVFAWNGLITDLRLVFDDELAQNGLLIAVGGDVDGCTDFNALLSGDQEYRLANHNINPEQAYILTMTSGSTGDPKPIVLSQGVKEKRAEAAIELYEVCADDVVLVATPMYHSLAERLVLIPLMSGGTSVILESYTARKWIDEVIAREVSFSIIVSSQLKQILADLTSNRRSLDSLRCLVSSSERLPDSVRKEMKHVLTCEFHECYGASEIAIATNLNHRSVQNASVGTAAPKVEIQILRDDGTLAMVGEVGEILCKTPMLFSGYYKKTPETASSMRGEYFCTGDVGKLDKDGYLTFLGRKKDIIITGGINIYPKDIEDVLNSHHSVAECAVIPLPDDILGERLTAVVVAEAGEQIVERQLQRLCARELADYQQPRHYIISQILPKNAMGKVMKQAIISQFTHKVSAGAS
ncbi:class I adenylate-forming enzyme family protein [Alkalimarinus alittae]|uniref:Acyl--CoA ligase n=1 Tax=Alkalimarinus alittae TaxID=2961619 RepID=A0ABY6N652_9ALTE|nr:class I adenylate-forming enzyme family protein [Alkalimarinus alittae]UZE97559.1 acyl--CoA ligase [Alkalimarinus alittae]